MGLVRYQAASQAPKGAYGIVEHTDWGFITIIAQDHQGGLEVKTKKGDWINVEPIKNLLVVNIGEVLEYWTHCIFRATPHRVKITNGNRLSIVYFFEPILAAPMNPIPCDLLPA
jgi:isopenicillin N synthase-like dioxygenase